MTSSALSNLPLATDAAGHSLWSRIAAELAQAIRQGVYPPGQRLPTEHALAEQYGVNRHTVRRSLASLCSQGLLRASRGSGTYVEDFALDLALTKRPRHRESLAQAGLRGALQVLQAHTVRADAALARALAIAPRSAVLRLHVLGEAEGQPMDFSHRHFPLARFRRLADIVRETGSITEAFKAHGVHDYVRRDSRITAQMPDATIAAHLRQSATRPVLLVESTNVDLDGRPIEWTRAWFAGDRIALTFEP